MLEEAAIGAAPASVAGRVQDHRPGSRGARIPHQLDFDAFGVELRVPDEETGARARLQARGRVQARPAQDGGEAQQRAPAQTAGSTAKTRTVRSSCQSGTPAGPGPAAAARSRSSQMSAGEPPARKRSSDALSV